ncbi:uncharacterized protein PV09_02284 [Verruconis gallopava]|uniref:Major facilitator superfamily (MFS) profile domain-containing protein n=1 Tax=Verruconis gallopava TaxID=253628 RepID=A0A0D2ALU0_9PEZI|nr:uncharacterized protein PV09_02284 [Verruconis gallopava]KIW07445.1 hypothetical protein PV09_02284 [Verruconis gallopava]
MATALEKDSVAQQLEHGSACSHYDTHHDELAARGFAADSQDFPKGYFTSAYFLGSMIAVGFNLMASTGGFALVAPILNQINAAVGPSESITWLSLVYTICLAVGLLTVGSLSDIFGRRWFFIGGTALGVIGCIVSATGDSVPILVGGETLIGLSACTGYSYAFVSGELVPVKYRFLANAIIFIFSLPTAGFGAAVSTAFILYTEASWRWVYYFLLILNAVTCALYFFFYQPPTLQDKHGKGHAWGLIKNFDYVGLILFIAGLVLFILGLSSGGSLYPWKDVHTVSWIVIGCLLIVALLLWETYAPLKEPLLPMHFFRNGGYMFSALSLGLGASTYYSQAIVFPGLISTVYANGRLMWAGWASCLVGIAVTIGEMIGGGLAERLGKLKYQCIAVMTAATLFLGLMGFSTITSSGLAMGLVFMGTFFVGWNEALVLPICSIVVPNQKEIGRAIGAAGSMRSVVSTVASTIYSVVLTNRLTSTIRDDVPQALLKAGLPASSVNQYMAKVAGGSKDFSGIAGVTEEVEVAGSLAYRHAYLDAYHTIFYVSIAFSSLAAICNILVPNIDHLMSNAVAAKLHEGRKTDGVRRKEDIERGAN